MPFTITLDVAVIRGSMLLESSYIWTERSLRVREILVLVVAGRSRNTTRSL